MAGNGPYKNRGCEAIVRGSVKILNKYFDENKYIVSTVFADNKEFEKQKSIEFDKSIIHTKINVSRNKYDFYWFIEKMRKYYSRSGEKIVFGQLNDYIDNSSAVLSVGGDNYSLDYGVPRLFTSLDDYVMKKKIPIVIWGASVGPFTSMPEYEKYILNHLSMLDGIFVRETSTLEYLYEKGIKSNVYLVADPAFLMEPEKPEDFEINVNLNEAIGLNLSPLFSKFLCSGNRKEWVLLAAKIVDELIHEFKRALFLIPHVESESDDWDDYKFLQDVYECSKADKTFLNLVPQNLNAAQLKWIISQVYVFAGARTHSTIAALSTGVPTLSLAYSLKATGINKDVYGNCEYCLNPEEIDVNKIIEKIGLLISNYKYLRNKLNDEIPYMFDKALLAGKYLKNLIDSKA